MGPLALGARKVTTTAIAPQTQPIAHQAAAAPPRASTGQLALRLESVTLGGGAETRAEREAQQAVALRQQRREAEAQRMATAQQEAKLLQDKRDAAAAALQNFWAERAASMRHEAEEQHELAMAEAQRKRRSDGQGHIGAKVARHTDDTVDTVEAEMGPPTSTPAGSDQLGDRFFFLVRANCRAWLSDCLPIFARWLRVG